MAVTEEDKQSNIAPKPASPAPPPFDIPAECRDAVIAFGKDITDSLHQLGNEKALTQPGAAEQALMEGAGGSALRLAECLQRTGKLPGGKPVREGRPMS
jgi:hypothetical protein